MAEKATSKHAICVTLTYANVRGRVPDAAKMFFYKDVRAYIHRLNAASRRLGKAMGLNISPRVRFLCAGEQGDRNGRCHWHLIIYSDLDLTSVGKFTLRGREVSNPADLWSVGKHYKRLHWSMWPHGFVTLQQPDEGAMHYVLSYCLKDQFTVERSQGSGRFKDAENFATGLFKMSKKPPIGSEWLYSLLSDCEARLSVLPSLELKVPEMGGYWYPSGLMRQRVLERMVEINDRVRTITGGNAPQWTSLLASCADNPKDLEILLGPQEEHPDDEISVETQIHRSSRENAYWHYVANPREAQGCRCSECLGVLSDEALWALGAARVQDGQETTYVRLDASQGAEPYPVHRWCSLEPARDPFGYASR